ncbi:MAG TPA: twin-arginine translocation signal domain-containing protein, partial [Polyangiaceae bacterium LLY-WYZ-15_(1-7)]|nr:twin-arginine translocation signal domain-containing protein [Polyangiaceae bacterium LLY-WYZ-15_(1-7)]
MSRRKPYEFASGKGPVTWRSLEDKQARPEEKKALAEAERPGGFLGGLVGTGGLLKKKAGAAERSPLADQPRVSRRGFLATTGTATAALSLAGCVRRPKENILPYVQGPEYQLPGRPLHFATVTQRGNDALGILVTSHVGRPTKVEGNAEHPSSLGATDARAQQMVWDLYDPDRSRGPAQPTGDGFEDKTFAEFDAAYRELIAAHAG